MKVSYAAPGRGLALVVKKEPESSSSGSDSDEDTSSKCCRCCRRRKPEVKASGEAEAESFALGQAYFTETGNTDRMVSHDHSKHVTDEVFNAASHFMGGMLSTLGTAVLVTGASTAGDPWAIVGFSVYGACLMNLFFSSFAHHGIRGSERLMRLLRTLDYVAIYFLIPGTMTPVCFICLHDRWEGWVFMGSCWGLAILGVIMQTACRGGMAFPKWASMTMYITLGWFGGLLAPFVFPFVGWGGLGLLAVGGLAYTGGGIIFQAECPNPVPGKFGYHEIWHCFVLLGAALHWAMIFVYVFPNMKGYQA